MPGRLARPPIRRVACKAGSVRSRQIGAALAPRCADRARLPPPMIAMGLVAEGVLVPNAHHSLSRACA
jgi:hypothetical protein